MRYETGRDWTLFLGDCTRALRWIAPVDHCITDPPYSPLVHSKSRGAAPRSAAGYEVVREREFGFDPLDAATRRAVARDVGRLVKRWTLVFCDLESVHLWRRSLSLVGVEPVRIGIWIKEGCSPQFTGDRPASGAEGIVVAHPSGRKTWNGGGARAVWSYPIVGRGFQNGAHDGKSNRVHTAQKPIALMLDLVELFTDQGDAVLDPFAGSATTGVACLRRGRRFVGIEKDPAFFEVAVERLRAEEQGLSLAAARAGQVALFGGAR